MIMSSLKIIVVFIHPFHARNQSSPIYLPFQALRQEECLITPIPSRKMDRHQHDPRVVSVVRHTSMPQPEITNDQRPLRQRRLQWRTDSAALLDQIATYSVAGQLRCVRRFGVCVRVTAEPDLRGTIFGGRVHEVDVNAESERDLGEVEVYIDMDGLATVGFERGVGAVEAHVRVWSEHTFCDGDGPGIGDDIVEDVPCFDDGLLLDITCSRTEVAMRFRVIVQNLGFFDHTLVQFVEMSWVDGIGDGADSISMESLDGFL